MDKGYYLIHLIKCSLLGETAQPIPEGVTWEEVYRLAVRNSTESMCWPAASKAEGIPVHLRQMWQEDYNKTLYRRLMFDTEREAIFKELADRGIFCLPLKGVVLQEYYPQPEMRSMCDNDFLYGFIEPAENGGYRIKGANKEQQEESVKNALKVIKEVMEGRGYETKSLGMEHHDSFVKEPFFNFESHRSLLPGRVNMEAYSDSAWSRAIQSESDPYLYCFSPEDTYIFTLAHAFKHYDNAGCGIRFVVDIRVFLDKEENTMDWKYIGGELEKLGLSEFERKVRTLAASAFLKGGVMSGDDREMLAYLLGSGTYGTMANRVQNDLNKKMVKTGRNARAAKRRYIYERLFDLHAVETIFPGASKIKPLIPFLLIGRGARGLIRRPRSIKQEMKYLLSSEPSESSDKQDK